MVLMTKRRERGGDEERDNEEKDEGEAEMEKEEDWLQRSWM